FGATALATPAVLSQALGEPAAAKPHRIDVHHHMFPPFVQELWKKTNTRAAPVTMQWTLEQTLDQMNRAGVRTTVLSVLASGGFQIAELREQKCAPQSHQ